MVKRVTLIKQFFGMNAKEAIEALKELTDDDKNQLASAIVKRAGIEESECDFSFVEY